MRWWVALVCVAACGGDTGVDLEIRSEVPIESVEIFIANSSCTELDGVTPCREEVGWLDGQPPVAGKIYELHNADFDKQKLELRLTPEASPDGSTYTLRLVAEGAIGDSTMIAIVGLDSSGQARALAMIKDEIPEHSAEHWVVTLQAADPATATLNRPSGTDTERRVAVWGRDGTTEQQAGARCLVVQDWTGDEWKSKFVVPASDHDCDGVLPELECDDQYFHLNQQRRAACVVAHPNNNGLPGACTVGLSNCRDGTGNDPGCQTERLTFDAPVICVPDRICELCDGPYGVVPCVQANVQSDGAGHATCRIYGSASDGSACGLNKSGSVAKLALPFLDCTAYDVRPLAMPLIRTQSTDFVVQQGNFRVDVNTLAECSLTIHFLSGKIENGSAGWVILGVYPRLNETTVMLVPIKIEFPAGGTDCNGGFVPEDCGVSGLETDNIRSCGL